MCIVTDLDSAGGRFVRKGIQIHKTAVTSQVFIRYIQKKLHEKNNNAVDRQLSIGWSILVAENRKG